MNNGKRKVYKTNTVFGVGTALMAVTCSLIILFGVQMHRTYNVLAIEESSYRESVKAVQEFRTGSEILSRDTKKAAEEKEVKYITEYFGEADSLRRENALVVLNENVDDASLMQKAYEASVEMMDMEYHIMRLVLEAKGSDMSMVRDEVKTYILTPEEQGMGRIELYERALDIAHGNEYENKMQMISGYTREFIDQTIEDNNENIITRGKEILTYTVFIMALGIILFVLIIMNFYYNKRFTGKVLEDLVKGINEGRRLKEDVGLEELRCLAVSYNEKSAELDKLRQREGEYKKAVMSDGMCMYEINITNDRIESIITEDDEQVFSAFLDRLGFRLPCSYSEYNTAAYDYVIDSQKKQFESLTLDYMKDRYRSGNMTGAMDITYDFDDVKMTIRTIAWYKKDSVTDDIVAILVAKKMNEERV